MQGLCLDNNERKETMNSYFLDTADSNVIQSPISFESTKETLNRASSAIDSFPFIGFGEQGFLMCRVYFDDRLCPVLALNKLSQLITAIASITNNILRMKFAIGESCLTENTTGNTSIMGRTSANIGSYRKLILSICQKMKLITKVEFLFSRCIELMCGYWAIDLAA